MTTECKLPECVVTGFNPTPDVSHVSRSMPEKPAGGKSPIGAARLAALKRQYDRTCVAEQAARRRKKELLKIIRKHLKASRTTRTR